MSQVDYTALQKRTYEACRKEGWDRGWKTAGCCLHLEASEFIEALRGKHGDPIEEAGDVLFVLMSMLEDHGISIDEVACVLEMKMDSKGQ